MCQGTHPLHVGSHRAVCCLSALIFVWMLPCPSGNSLLVGPQKLHTCVQVGSVIIALKYQHLTACRWHGQHVASCQLPVSYPLASLLLMWHFTYKIAVYALCNMIELSDDGTSGMHTVSVMSLDNIFLVKG